MARTRVLRAGHYFLAVEGLAMIRDFLSDPEALAPRAEEVRSIVAAMDEFPNSLEIPVTCYDVDDGYTLWAPRYDGPNPAIATEEPVVATLLDAYPPDGGRVALDAACGTGRQAALLDARGWKVIGVDATPAMLDVARAKVPAADLRTGHLDALPVDDESVDLVICSLALTHVEDLGPVVNEFARVLRPGGTLITTDINPHATSVGSGAAFPIADRGEGALEVHFVPNLFHPVSDYVAAFTGAGLTIRSCHEPPMSDDALTGIPAYGVVPEATVEAFGNVPYLLIWEVHKFG